MPARIMFPNGIPCLCSTPRLQQSLRLGRLKSAWESAIQLKSPDIWKGIGMAALERLDMDMALAAFR